MSISDTATMPTTLIPNKALNTRVSKDTFIFYTTVNFQCTALCIVDIIFLQSNRFFGRCLLIQLYTCRFKCLVYYPTDYLK